MTLPPLRTGQIATADLVARRARMPTSWTPAMLEAGTVARDEAIGGVTCLICERSAGSSGTILYFHGGGYRMGSPAAWAGFASRLAAATGLRIVVPDYRLAPEHPFPAGLHDALAVHRALTARDNAPPIAAGDSAGGGLACALAQACRATGASMPAALILLSPFVDLTITNATYETRPGDLFFPKTSAQEAAAHYLQGHDPTDPLASPLLGALSGFPRSLILASADECLVGDALALLNGLTEARIAVAAHIVPAMTHVWPVIAPDLPESRAAIIAIADFARAVR